MPKDESRIAVEIRATPAAAARAPTPPSPPSSLSHQAADIPARFAGRVCFALDVEQTMDALDIALRRAARREAMSEDAVRQHCQRRGTQDHHMEWAVLREAFGVVSRELLIERLVAAARRRLTASVHQEIELDALAAGAQPGHGGVLVGAYRGTVTAQDNRLTVRCSVGSAIEPPLVIPYGEPQPARAAAIPLPVGGTLSIEGSFASSRPGEAPVQVRVHQRVAADGSHVRGWSPLASPLEDIVGHITTVSLSRIAAVLPGHLAALAHSERGPAFVQVERILRLGRMSKKSRIYLLYWQRLRDYMLWRVSSSAA